MADDLNEFIRRHRSLWQEAERLFSFVEQNELSRLDESQVRRFGEIYRTLSSQLITVRSQFVNAEIEDYLNDLVARGYSLIYRGRADRPRALWRFYSTQVPQLFRQNIRYVMTILGLLICGIAFGYVAGILDPESVYFIVESEYTSVSVDDYLKGKGSLSGIDESVVMMSMVGTNNLRVAILMFASGITFGIGTVAITFYNGVMVGSFCSIFFRAGKGNELLSLLVPHGLIEFFALLMAGAAGFLLAGALLFPGERTRALALREEGLKALKLFLGSVPVILGAMLIESTLSKFEALGPEIKYTIGFAALALVLAWLLGCGRGRAGAGVS